MVEYLNGRKVIGLYQDYIHLVDKKSSSTNGGTSTAGSWETRDLTDELADSGNNCSLSSNQFTLVAGTYRCLISAPAFRSSWHQIRLYNITDTALELLGSSEWNDSSASEAETRSICVGRFTIAAQKTFEVQHRVNASRADNGYGEPNTWGDNIFTAVELWKEA